MKDEQREALQRARETLADLRALEARKAKLLEELSEALALRALWPDLFEHGGRATAWWIVRKGPRTFRPQAHPPQGCALVIRSATGEERTFPVGEVPEELHPAIARLGR